MLKRNRRSVSGLVGLTLAALLALPAAALADTSAPIAQTGGMTVTLPLLGVPLKVDVTLDAVGNISNVDLTPTGEFSATRVGPHAVSFATADGTTKVKINARGDRMSVRASSGSLDSLLGSGTWTADLFGTGEMTEVDYTIGAAVNGSPTLAIDGVTAPDGVTVDQEPVETWSGDHGSSAWARMTFARDGFVKRLTIRVSLRSEGDRPASLTFELSGKDRQKLTDSLENLVGPHTWTGASCDGTPATVNFMVNADGTVSFTGATPAATTKDTKHGFWARFDGTHSKVKVRLWENEGTWTLKVEARADRCKDTPAAAPEVNTEVADDAVKPDHQGDWNYKGDSDHKGDRGDRGDRGGWGGGKQNGSGHH